MVIYRGADGRPGFQQTESLAEAIGFVEKLRNAEGVENARIYRLEQVTFSFETYYKVRVAEGAAPAVASAATAPPTPAPPAAPAAPAGP
ncbi:MAG: hypothetical protein ACKVWR_05150, partial [Acidimicrobiales bacterium]